MRLRLTVRQAVGRHSGADASCKGELLRWHGKGLCRRLHQLTFHQWCYIEHQLKVVLAENSTAAADYTPLVPNGADSNSM